MISRLEKYCPFMLAKGYRDGAALLCKRDLCAWWINHASDAHRDDLSGGGSCAMCVLAQKAEKTSSHDPA